MSTGGPWSGSAHGLVARDAELQAVRRHLTEGARVVTVVGIAGAGKTVLLSAAARAWSEEGGVVLRVRGHATEQLLGFSTLLDLLDAGTALRPETAGEADALRAGLDGREHTASPEALVLRREFHQWLLALAGEQQLLLVVDDVQWVDAASWSVLSFAANRLAGCETSVLLASRADVAPPGLDDQPVLDLRPLDLTESSALLDRAGPVLELRTRATVIERAGGNPLALLELARASGVVASGDDPTGTPPYVPAAVEAAFAADLPGLPEQTRSLLLLAAAGATELEVLHRVVGEGGRLLERLEPAERAGLVRVRGRHVTFRHPLVRSTIYDLATARERQAAHLTLAELYDGDDDRRVWHRAAATDGLDESVADDLAATSERLFARGAQREAVEAVVLAAELTADADLRDARLLDGMIRSSAVGWVQRVVTLAEHLREQTADPVVRARASHYHAYALAQSLRQAHAQEVLEEALDELIDLDPQAGWASLTTLATLVYQTGRRREALQRWLERYETLTPHDLAGSPVNAASRAWIVMALDPLGRPDDLAQVLRDAPETLTGDWPDFVHVAYDMLQGATAWLLDEHPEALRLLSRANDVMERSGAAHQLVQNTMALGQVQYDMGLYDDADRSGRLMIDLGEAQVLDYYQSVGRELRARVASVRGDSAQALDAIDRLLATVEPGQAPALETNLYVGRANALAGLHEHEAAYLQLRALFDTAGAPVHPHVSVRALGDLASAAVRVGRGEDVRDLVRAAAARVDDRPGQRMGRVVARARALVDADAEEAESLFERAVREPGAETWPLEWANAQLDLGVWLRRQHRAADARDLLRSAHRVYARLGATPRADAAESELRAAGVRLERQERPASGGWSDLTGQEREIVLLAASGMTNKEIGEALFLSRRTVGAHLYHAFPKLGVTSRTQLRDLVQQLREGT